MSQLINKFFIFFIKAYQFLISPLLGARCRFYPSCSQYALLCFHKFTFFKAVWYSLMRISKCHPFHKGGVDPIP